MDESPPDFPEHDEDGTSLDPDSHISDKKMDHRRRNKEVTQLREVLAELARKNGFPDALAMDLFSPTYRKQFHFTGHPSLESTKGLWKIKSWDRRIIIGKVARGEIQVVPGPREPGKEVAEVSNAAVPKATVVGSDAPVEVDTAQVQISMRAYEAMRKELSDVKKERDEAVKEAIESNRKVQRLENEIVSRIGQGANADMAAMTKELEQLRQMNQHLRGQLAGMEKALTLFSEGSDKRRKTAYSNS